MSPKVQLWIARVVGILALAGLLTMLFMAIPQDDGNRLKQGSQTLVQAAQDSTGIPGSYKYVADFETKKYWPNREPYTGRIPDGRRVYILDDATLSEFKGYTPGRR